MSYALAFILGAVFGYAFDAFVWPKILALYRLNKK